MNTEAEIMKQSKDAMPGSMQRMVRPHAEYRCMVGNRMQNKLISSAGLGITGAFQQVKYTLDWKHGEAVDESRAQKLCDVLKHGINESGELECQSVELLRVYVA